MKPGRALAFLAAYNLLQNALLNRRGYVAGNLAATALGLVWARRSGIGWRDLCLGTENLATGVQTGVAVAAVGSSAALLLRNRERVRALTNDVRLDHVSNGEAWFRLLVRFPLGTALFEEVWFRGILPAALRRWGARHPELVSVAAFTGWHMIPTAAAISSNETGRGMGRGEKTVLVLGGSVAAGIGGLGFAAMRQTSSSLVAPWVAHATFNGLSFWVAWRQRRCPPR